MTKRESVNRTYLGWIYSLLCDGVAAPYWRLFQCLYGIDFTYIMPMDGNRAADGVDLRYRFGRECSYDDRFIACYLDDRPCSVLEVMAALAIRCEVHIMDDPDIGDRTGVWFWDMVRSLGLEGMDDGHFNAARVRASVSAFLDRRYRKNGAGGLFTVNRRGRDMRVIDIWNQMCLYLNDILE